MGIAVRWSEEDWLRFQRRTAVAADRIERAIVQAQGGDAPRAQVTRMNKLEAAYSLQLEAERLAGNVLEWGFEDTRLRLADGAWFKPDFRVVSAGGVTEFHETKGFWREAARVRIKVAADKYPLYRFIAITRRRAKDGGGWKTEEFR